MNRSLVLSGLALVAMALPALPQGGGPGTLPFYGSLADGIPDSVIDAPRQGVDLPWGTYYAASAAIDPNAPVMSTSWETSMGTVTVTTPKLVNESTGNQAWAHRAAVNALLNDPGMNSLGGASMAGQYESEAGGSTMTTSWNSSPPPLTHSVSTPPIEGESLTEQADRHLLAVNALGRVFPPLTGEKTGAKTSGGATAQ